MPAAPFPFPARRDPRTGRFVNLPPPQVHGFRDVLRWKFGFGEGFTPAVPAAEIPPYAPEYVEPDPAALARPPADMVQLTWIGHSTWLIQVGGVNILTDPIYSRVCAPFPSLALRRRARPGVPWAQLPRIDAVVISHSHYDHLDRPTVRRLGAGPHFLVPTGLGTLLRRWGAQPVHEAYWGDEVRFAGVSFRSLPARHFSARTFWNRNVTLWCGWLVEVAGRRIYFAGDTAYGSFFPELGRHLGSIDVGLLPISAYQPRWFMREVHLDPAEAVQVHRDLRIRRSFAMHWGTFRLSDEPLGEPPVYLARARAAAGLPPEDFRVLKFGETVRV